MDLNFRKFTDTDQKDGSNNWNIGLCGYLGENCFRKSGLLCRREASLWEALELRFRLTFL